MDLEGRTSRKQEEEKECNAQLQFKAAPMKAEELDGCQSGPGGKAVREATWFLLSFKLARYEDLRSQY